MSDKPEKKTFAELAAKVDEMAADYQKASDASQECEREATRLRNMKIEAERNLNAAMKALAVRMDEVKVR